MGQMEFNTIKNSKENKMELDVEMFAWVQLQFSSL